jgi:phage terminase Nu1 subunit (DNA packaging protein)
MANERDQHEPPPDGDLPPVEGGLLSDPAALRADLALIRRAATAGWFTNPQAVELLKQLPDRLLLDALKADNLRDRNASAKTLMVVLRSLETLLGSTAQPPGGDAQGKGPTVAIQQNFGLAAGPPWIVATQEQVADFFGRSTETVKDWRAKGMPGAAGGPGAPGRYDLREILAWRDANIAPSGRDEGLRPDGDGQRTISRAEADRRRAVADAQRAELRVTRERNQVMDVAAVVREYQHHATHARALFEQVPHRLMEELPETATADDKRRFRDRAARIVDDVIRCLHTDLVREVATDNGACSADKSASAPEDSPPDP